MRLSVKPENILEAIALQTRKELSPFLLAMLGMGVSQAVVTAVRLGVFDALKEHPKTAAELAKSLNCDARGMQVLLESLDGFGFVNRQGERYKLTQESKFAKLNPAPKRLLDVAGGPAEYSITFCQQYPDLKVDVLDFLNAIKAGKLRIEEAGLSSRIRYIEGNLLETDWDTNYDVVFLSNILHWLKAEQCEVTLSKAFQALRSGGSAIVNDMFRPGDRDKLSSPLSLFSLIYYVICGGRIWPPPTILEWLTQIGFANLRSSQQRLGILVAG
ncbi:class I SAM-dependent methyltransferase [Microcoleus sp. N3A4]|uniref:class I SAM-dependent methyltransferase n=1 Tax=Microcoleus sp. N3A4 TaxID=3055379 RepID=UPI002FD466EE